MHGTLYALYQATASYLQQSNNAAHDIRRVVECWWFSWWFSWWLSAGGQVWYTSLVVQNSGAIEITAADKAEDMACSKA